MLLFSADAATKRDAEARDAFFDFERNETSRAHFTKNENWIIFPNSSKY